VVKLNLPSPHILTYYPLYNVRLYLFSGNAVADQSYNIDIQIELNEHIAQVCVSERVLEAANAPDGSNKGDR
jgi:hypothetical protein